MAGAAEVGARLLLDVDSDSAATSRGSESADCEPEHPDTTTRAKATVSNAEPPGTATLNLGTDRPRVGRARRWAEESSIFAGYALGDLAAFAYASCRYASHPTDHSGQTCAWRVAVATIKRRIVTTVDTRSTVGVA
jgi:hypothetical protein